MAATIDLPTLLQRVQLDPDGFTKGVGKIDEQSSKASKSILSVGSAVKIAAASFAGIAAFNFFKDAINAASDLNETTSKVGVIFGDAAGAIEDFASTADTSLGQSKQSALDGAATFGVFGKSAGLAGEDLADFSTSLVSLASDMASFANTSPEDAITAIGAALRGESEPIRAYGVLLDDASLRQEALRQGLIATTKDALTPQQRVLAAYQLILKQTADAQGDFERTSDQLANSQRILTAQFENLKAEVGTALLPALLGVVGAVGSSLIPAIERAAQAVTPLAVAFGETLAAVMPAVVSLIDGFVEASRPLVTLITTLAPLVAEVATALGDLFAAALAAITPLINAASAGVTALAQAALPSLTAVLEGLLPAVESFGDIMIAIEPALTAVATAIGTVVGTLGPFALAFGGAFKLVSGLPGLFDKVAIGLYNMVGALESTASGASVAATGFIAMHPVLTAIGIAAGIAGAAFLSWSKERQAEKKLIKEFTDAILADTEAIGGNTSAIGENEEALLRRKLREEGTLDDLDKIVGHLHNGKSAWETYTAAIQGSDQAQQDIRRALIESEQAFIKIKDAQGVVIDDPDAVEALTRSWIHYGGTIQDAELRTHALAGGQTALIDGSLALTDQITKESKAHAEGIDARNQEIRVGAESAETAGAEAEAKAAAADATVAYTTAIGGSVTAQQAGAEAGGAMATAISATGEATEETIKPLDRLKQLIEQLTGNAIGVEEANRKWEESLDGLTASIVENGNTLDIGTEKGRANRDSLQQSAEAALGVAEANVQAGQSVEDATNTLSLQAEQLLQTAKAAGLNEQEAAQLTATLLGIPPDVTTTIKNDADLQRVVAEHYNTELGKIPTTKETKVSAPGMQETISLTQRLIDKFGSLDDAVGRVGGIAGLTGRASFTVQGEAGSGFHTGGIVPGGSGRETRMRLLGGEGVITEQTVSAIGRDLFGRQVTVPSSSERSGTTVVENHFHVQIEPKYATFDETSLERTLERLELFG